MELKKSVYRLADDDPELRPWDARLAELSGDTDDIDEMLAEIEQKAADEAQNEARHQLELFGALLTDLAVKRDTESHQVVRDGREYVGTWEEIVSEMRDTADDRRQVVRSGVHDDRGAPRTIGHGSAYPDARRRKLHPRQRRRRIVAHRAVTAVGGASASAPPVLTSRLANGLTVLVRRDSTAPAVAIVTHVRAGYFDETDDVVGIAHVLEHMYFKGTPTRGVGEIARATKATGGYLNAHTIYDHTSYYTVVPSARIRRGPGHPGRCLRELGDRC